MKHRAIMVMDWDTIKYLLKWPKDLELKAIRCQGVEKVGTIEMVVEGDVPGPDPFNEMARITPRYDMIESGNLHISNMRGFVFEDEAVKFGKR